MLFVYTVNESIIIPQRVVLGKGPWCTMEAMCFTSVDVHTLLYLANSISILITTQYGSTHVQNIPLYYVESANFVRVLYLYW